MSREGASHLWGAQGAADPSVGAGGVPGVPAGSLTGDSARHKFLWVPGLWRPASVKS